MKNILGICAGISLLAAISCKKNLNEFLDKAPGVDVTENSIFSSRVNAESYVSTLYQFGMASIFLSRDQTLINNPITPSSSAISQRLMSQKR